MTKLDTPWYVEVHGVDGNSFVLVETEDDPSYCELRAVLKDDQGNPDVVTSRLIGNIFAKPLDAMRLLRAVGYTFLDDKGKVVTDDSAEDREDYFTLLDAG